MERYYLKAIYSIDRNNIKQMIKDFNSADMKHKSTKPLKANNFLPYLKNPQ